MAQNEISFADAQEPKPGSEAAIVKAGIGDLSPVPDFIEPGYGDNEIEANPANDVALDKAIANAKTPEALKALSDEKDRRAGIPKPAEMSFEDAKPKEGEVSFTDAQSKPKGLGGRLADAYSAEYKKIQALNDQDADEGPLPTLTGRAYGAVVGAGSGLAQIGNSVYQRVLGQPLTNPGQSQQDMSDTIKRQNEGIQNFAENLPGMQTPSAKAGQALITAPFAGVHPIVQSMTDDPRAQSNIEEAINIGAMALPGMHGGERAIVKPSLIDRLDGVGKPKGEPVAPEASVTPPDAPAGGGVPKTQGDLFGTEQVGTNPFLDPSQLSVDENGIPRNKGLSTDVQREAYDIPANEDLLTQATKEVADNQDRATPHTQDQVNLEQDALWQAQERHEIMKESTTDQMWRDYEASNVVARIPALKETLENPIGSGMPRVKDDFFPEEVPTEFRPKSGEVNMSPEDQAITRPMNRGLGRRQSGAIDISDLGALVDKFKGWFSKDSFEKAKAAGDQIAEVSTAMFRKYGPDVNLGESRQERIGSIEQGRGSLPIPSLEVEKMNGVWTVVDHDGRHRSDVLLKNGVSTMPVVIKDPTGEFAKDNPKTIRSQNMETILPNPNYEGAKNPSTYAKGLYEDAPHYDGRPAPMREAASAVQKSNPNFGKFKQGGGINISGLLKARPEAKPLVEEFLKNDKRSGMEFMHDLENNKELDHTTDVGAQLGLHSGSFRALLEFINNPKSAAHKVAFYLDNKIGQMLEEVHKLNYGTDAYYNKLYKLYGDKFLIPFKLDKFRSDLKVVLGMEGGEGWFDPAKQNYVPSVKDLMDAGLDPKSAQVWNGIHTALDNAWDTASKAIAMSDKSLHMPDRVPGYLPHQFNGAYQVRVFKEHTDLKTNEITKDYFGTFGSHTIWQARAHEKALAKIAADNGLKTEIVLPKAEGTNSAELMAGMWRASQIMDKKGANNALGKLTRSLYESTAQGIVTSILDRKSPTQIGFELQRVSEKGAFKLTSTQAADALRGIQQTHKAVNNWYARVKFANEVLFPLDMGGAFKGRDNLSRLAQNWVNQSFELPNSMIKGFDEWLRDKMIRVGGDPSVIQSMMASSNSAFAKLYLFAKPAFYAANRLQSTMTPAVLLTLKSMNGGKGSVLKAMATALPDIAKAQLGLGKLIEEAKALGHISPSFMENMGPAQFQDPISSYIEKTTRSESFLVSYHYFKQFMGHDDAMASAGKAADMVSVPYDQAKGSPTALTRLPASLKPLTLFATYNQHMLGMVDMQVRAMVEAKKQNNSRALATAAGGIMALQGMQVAMFGLGGVTMAQTYDSIIMSLNKMGYDFPTTKVLGRKIGEATGIATLGAMAQFGIPSTATGMDFSTSGSGANIQVPSAYGSMMATFGGIAIAGLAAIKHGGATADEQWAAVKGLPGQVTGLLEHYLKGESLQDVYDQLQGKKDSYTPDPKLGLHARNERRTPGEVALNMSGANSTRQADMTVTDRLLSSEQKSQLEEIKHWANAVCDTSMSKEIRQEAAKNLTSLYYKNPSSVVQEVMKYNDESHTTSSQRRAQAATGSIAQGIWYTRFLKEQGLEPVAKGQR